MINVNNGNLVNLNTIYNEGKISKNENKSFVSFIEKELADTDGRISHENTGFSKNKSELLLDIVDITGSDAKQSSKLRALSSLLKPYGVPSICIYALCGGRGNIGVNDNDKLFFEMPLSDVNIGTLYDFNWVEGEDKKIIAHKGNGSSIMTMDDDEINNLFEYIDKHNEEVKELIDNEVKERLENEMIEDENSF